MRRVVSPCLALCLSAGAVHLACHPAVPEPTEEPTLVHLTEDPGTALVAAGPVPERQELAWSFAEGLGGWESLGNRERPHLAQVTLRPIDGGLRVSLEQPSPGQMLWIAGLAIELGDLSLRDWDTVLVRARCRDRLAGISIAYNLDEEGALPGAMAFLASGDEALPVFNDGSEQLYSIPLRPRTEAHEEAPLRDLGILVAAPGPAVIDLYSVTLVPRGAEFPRPVGTSPVVRQGTTRDTLYARTPVTLSYLLHVASPSRLDVGLAALPTEALTYRVSLERAGRRQVLLEETVADAEGWHQRSVALPGAPGAEARLILEAESEQAGAVALWGAPIVSVATGETPADRPNVLFYVIDGGGADLMSLYEYGRPTTPFLEELAAEGVVFERAYSNATWTQPSTVSFMTSLQHSVLGGLRRGVHSTPVPKAATTMAEHFRRGGYQTASFTSNPNAGRILGLERGVDVLRDVETEHHSTSSHDLHELFWKFRQEYSGAPWWVHFQTTDVHEPNEPVEPWAGRFLSPEERARAEEQEGRLWQAAFSLFGKTGIEDLYRQALDRSGVPRREFFEARRALYDETLLHQDDALRRFVERLKSAGEWEDTILVVGADHGHPAGTFARWGRGLLEPQPEAWQGALFDAYATRVPLLVIWPGHLPAGRRVETPVSMIDVLPTLLDLAGLPAPDVLQGRSLAPLLRGEINEAPPVILDEFRVDEATGEMIGNLEIVDGRWGASLEIGPVPGGDATATEGRRAVPAGGRWGAVHPFYDGAPRLLLYDLERDPFATRAVNDEHPELVERYRRLLYRQWQAHLALAQRFTEAGEVALTPEQLQQLRALGYI
jgi:arylsulfatase A-like enzyme